MRTRRSPKNQERLWRYLSGPKPTPIKLDPAERIKRLTERLADPSLRPRKRRMLECDLAKARRAMADTTILAAG